MSNTNDIQAAIAEASWIEELKERVIVLRHGVARTLEAGIVISGMPEGGDSAYGLTEAGRTGVLENVKEAMRNRLLSGAEKVVSSPFSRTRETACIFCDVLGLSGFDEDSRLSERYFGEYDGGPSDVYPDVWALDREDPTKTVRGVESLTAITERLFDFFSEWHQTHREMQEDRRLVVVTHGDPALLIRSLFLREDPRWFRDGRDLEPGAFLDLSGFTNSECQ